MKTFKQYINEVKKPTGDLKKACWTGYTAVGMKMKGGRKVPNCVPEEVVKEDGIGIGGAVPVNNVGGGNIAGSGGKGGEPGVNPKNKKGPVLIQMAKRKPPMA
jgi:hypothetical protein